MTEDHFEINSNILSLPAEIDAAKVNERSRKILDYASDSDPAEEEDPIDATALPPTDNSSECESVDSDMEDPLK